MGEGSPVGLDIAKSVFQVYGVDVDGAVVIRKRVSRAKVLANTNPHRLETCRCLSKFARGCRTRCRWRSSNGLKSFIGDR